MEKGIDATIPNTPYVPVFSVPMRGFIWIMYFEWLLQMFSGRCC